jgi:hypothetical protein
MTKRTGETEDREMRPEPELKQIATELWQGKIFCDLNIRPHERERMLTAIFMPLVFMNQEQIDEFKKPGAVGLIYEYFDKSAPRSVNGYPIFFSLRTLNVKETEWVFNMVEKIKAAVDGCDKPKEEKKEAP